ncbi:MAG: IS200/IS605 family transposase [Elainella sp. Prado103]|jgi:putative transposase|nr:IS200/IS605 family transposase [Elainella sp. Prado103]
MALWQLYYHFVWATKERNPMITPNKETELYQYVIGKANILKCIIHAINGTTDHVHIIVSVPPTLAISDFVKQIKGSSAHYMNHALSTPSEKFVWQAGYGVFSLGRKQLNPAVAYVQNQKLHHAEGTIITSLEQVTDDDIPKL